MSVDDARVEAIIQLIQTLNVDEREKVAARLAIAQKAKRERSLFGILKHLGNAPSAEEIDEIRKECWGRERRGLV
jgi:hypothetical protein